MILDGSLSFSALATGDAFTAQTDNDSTNVIDTGVNGLAQFRGEGGAYVAPFLIAKVHTAFAGSGTITVVLQDAKCTSATDATPTDWTDILVSPYAPAGTAAAINVILVAERIPVKHRRFLKVVYRVGTSTVSTGYVSAFLTLDRDVIDQALRHVTYSSFTQTGQISTAVSNSVAGS